VELMGVSQRVSRLLWPLLPNPMLHCSLPRSRQVASSPKSSAIWLRSGQNMPQRALLLRAQQSVKPEKSKAAPDPPLPQRESEGAQDPSRRILRGTTTHCETESSSDFGLPSVVGRSSAAGKYSMISGRTGF
jgi:hypothetical protein